MRLIQLALLSSPWAHLIFRFFRRLGPFGLLLFSALDSSFCFLPFGNDVLLIALVSANRGGLVWILYVFMSAVGSVLGVLTIDFMMRAAGEDSLRKFVKPKRIEQIKNKMERHAGWALFLATVVPPPFPFTPVIMTASALQIPRPKLLGTVFCGRLLRFTLEAVLAIYFGRKLLRYMNSDLFEYFVYGFIAIALVGSGFSIMKWLRHRGQDTGIDRGSATQMASSESSPQAR